LAHNQFSKKDSLVADLLPIIMQALVSELGVSVKTNNPEKLRADFYIAVKAMQVPVALQFTIGPKKDRLYLIKKEQPNVEA
jgi:hypothetical protein